MVGKDIYNHGKQNAIIFLFGVGVPHLEFGYSYDFSLSSLGLSSGGAHEITLGYLFKRRTPIKYDEGINSYLVQPYWQIL